MPRTPLQKILAVQKTSAKTKVGLGFQITDRGKLIMACGLRFAI